MKISLSNLFHYFSVSGDSKQKNSNKKRGTLTTTGVCGGGGRHHPKVPLFLTPPLIGQGTRDSISRQKHVFTFINSNNPLISPFNHSFG